MRGDAQGARGAVLQALHAGRGRFLAILRDGAELLCDSDAVARQIADGIEQVDSLWSAEPAATAAVAVELSR